MIKTDLIDIIELANPWLQQPVSPIFPKQNYIPRVQLPEAVRADWDPYVTVLTGPRQAGKTTLAKLASRELINDKRYPTVLSLNCDERLVREWFTGSHILKDIERTWKLSSYILLIDEIQRLETPGLILKAIHDLHLPIKLMATGSAQLELKSKLQEYLTGRNIEILILPLSYKEIGNDLNVSREAIYGCYPQIVLEKEKTRLLAQLYNTYIKKDLIEILKIQNVDQFETLLSLIAHASGQLVNYQQLATDCKISVHKIQHFLSILENTYVLASIKPFVGNKRTEVTSNPIYYFLDNGFRNQALQNFLPLEKRTDAGLLVQSLVFQELYKWTTQQNLSFSIHYWRTKGGAEVDFVLIRGDACIPIEVKYMHFHRLQISRGFRSFLEAYQPKLGVIITKDTIGELEIGNTIVRFVSLIQLREMDFINP